MSPALFPLVMAVLAVLANLVGPSPAPAVSAHAAAVAQPLPRPLAPVPHRLAWLNAWADHHTAQGGDHPSARSGAARMRLVVEHLRHTSADVGVLAEVEQPQRDAFDRLAGSSFGQVRSADALDDVVVYRRSVFALVSAGVFGLRYQGGAVVRTPVVVLAERATGRRVAVVPVHLPASTPAYGDQRRWRAADLATLVGLVRRLQVPVIIAGDFNEHDRPLCTLGSVGLASATGARCGSAVSPPIDQAFLSPSLGAHSYRIYRGRSVTEATDHAAFYGATFTLAPAPA